MVGRHINKVMITNPVIFLIILLSGLAVGASVAFSSDSGSSYGRITYAQAAVSDAGFDFTISNSGDVKAQAYGAGNTTIAVTLVSGQAESVNLSCSAGLPDDTWCIFTPSSALPSFTSNLIIVTRSSPGSYPVTVTGFGGGVTHTTQFMLRVSPRETVRLGGSVLPVDFLRLLVPYIVVAALAIGSGIAYLGLNKRRKQ